VDEGGGEPVVLLALFQHGLKCAQAEGQIENALPVDRAGLAFMEIVRRRNVVAMSTAMMPRGMLMKKIQRQPKLSVR